MAVEQALENLKIDKQYSIASTEEFVADFTQRLILGIDSESDITVNILAVDIEKGLLDVEVIETYHQLNGSVGKASYRKTVILDEIYPDAVEQVTITFLVEREGIWEPYKVFSIAQGGNVIFPGAQPSKEGHRFVGWSKSEDSTETVASAVAEPNMKFYAVFESLN